VLKERDVRVTPYAPQIPLALPMIVCNEKTAANHLSYDIAKKTIKIIHGL
jgi:hypothetical protein